MANDERSPYFHSDLNGVRVLDIGVDVGGTFTDIVVVGHDDTLKTTKIPTTPGRQHVAIVEGIQRVLEEIGAQPEDVHRVIHGTTVATNAIIEQKGAVIGILMTEGFEDTLELGRYKRSSNYDIWFDADTPVFLAPKRRRKGIRERLDHMGKVLVPLDETSIRDALVSLVEEHAVDAIAVCYLFSFENPQHEERTAEIARELYPSLEISLSSQVNPEIREYERLCVTAFDAYIRPVVGRYLSELAANLTRIGISAPLQVMESRGGIADARRTVERPSKTIMSGPAAGVMGAMHAAAAAGYGDIVSIDIGGTSSDVSLVADGHPLTSREGKILTYPVRVPMIDVNSIGAGGGSIAWFDAGGGLRVGPRSAGSDPGPACYGRGGVEATVTDASVVLGYIDPAYFAGGTFQLDPNLAHGAVGRIASRLGVGLPEAAWGIHRIVNANMTDQIRVISVGRGHDPRRFALVLLGGAGSLHGCPMANDLGISTLIVPVVPGVLSAFGLLVSNVEHEETSTFHVPLDAVASKGVLRSEFAQAFARMDADGYAVMEAQQIPRDSITIDRRLDVRYVGQSYELEVPIHQDLANMSTSAVAEAFDQAHREIYGHVRRRERREIVNLRTVHVFSLPRPTLVHLDGTAGSLESARKGDRTAYFGALGFMKTPVYDRAGLPEGGSLEGPVIVEQPDTTAVVHPGWSVSVDSIGQMIISKMM